MSKTRLKPVFFRTPADLQEWFDANHRSASELWVGYRKKSTGQPSVTWPESVDEALCVGWIDGIRKRIDEKSYTIRFTPRKTGSIWSAINIRRVAVLSREKRMRPSGRKAFAARTENRSGIYSYEQRPTQLVEPYRSVFQRNKKAWAFFEAQPPGYQKQVTWWVISAKREETRRKRLKQLVQGSAAGRRIR
ncbi:MAG TPA: YdeI/OmpD-associated family protein [Thermoanaerobaculia bacterium]